MDALGNIRAIAVAATTAGGTLGEVQIFHRLGGAVVGVWRGDVSCLRVEGATAIVTGVITLGEERAQGIDLDGRAFRVALTDGSPDQFQVQVLPPDVVAEPCSPPATPINTVDRGDLVVTDRP